MSVVSKRLPLLRNILIRSFAAKPETKGSKDAKGSKGSKDAKASKSECTSKSKDDKKPAEKPPEKKPKLKTFKVYRFDPVGQNKKPTMKSYTIDLNDCRPMVLDALIKIKADQDSTIAFRRSCREGICGSCGANIDGKNKLLCLTKINPRGTTKIYPLPHMYVIKDLIVDMNRFQDQHNKIKPYLMRKNFKPREEGQQQFLQSIKDRDSLIGQVECILCACCSTSCPEYWWHGHSKEPNDFLGPAALLNAHRWIVDTRDNNTMERLDQMRNYFNVYRCHQINNCTLACPKRLNPSRAIANIRKYLAGLSKKKKPDIEGMKPADPNKGCSQPKKC